MDYIVYTHHTILCFGSFRLPVTVLRGRGCAAWHLELLYLLMLLIPSWLILHEKLGAALQSWKEHVVPKNAFPKGPSDHTPCRGLEMQSTSSGLPGTMLFHRFQLAEEEFATAFTQLQLTNPARALLHSVRSLTSFEAFGETVKL